MTNGGQPYNVVVCVTSIPTSLMKSSSLRVSRRRRKRMRMRRRRREYEEEEEEEVA